MRDNSIKSTDKLTLKIIRGLAFSASLVSAFTFMNLTGGSSSLLAQNNSGNDYFGNQRPNGNSINGGRGNNNSRYHSPNHYRDNRRNYDQRRRIRLGPGNYNERIIGDYKDQKTNCNRARFDRSVCGNLEDGMNNY